MLESWKNDSAIKVCVECGRKTSLWLAFDNQRLIAMGPFCVLCLAVAEREVDYKDERGDM